MGWRYIIVGSHDLHNVTNAYFNVVNAIATFFEPTPPTNIITNETILTQCIIKQELKVKKRARLQYEDNCNSFMTAELSIQRSITTSLMNNKARA